MKDVKWRQHFTAGVSWVSVHDPQLGARPVVAPYKARERGADADFQTAQGMRPEHAFSGVHHLAASIPPLCEDHSTKLYFQQRRAVGDGGTAARNKGGRIGATRR